MLSMKIIERYDVIIPTRRRRLALVAMVSIFGGVVAHMCSPIVGWFDAALIILVLALLAGLSTLWSP